MFRNLIIAADSTIRIEQNCVAMLQSQKRIQLSESESKRQKYKDIIELSHAVRPSAGKKTYCQQIKGRQRYNQPTFF